MWLYKRIVYNCKEATHLLEKKHNEGISYLEEFELRVHLKGCYICRRYNDQSRIIDLMVRQLYKESKTQVFTLNEDFKEELKQHMNKELK